jgi:phage baseplate assembly protein W
MATTYSTSTANNTSATVADSRVSGRVYRGFSSVAGVKSNQLYDVDLVKQDLINHFYTRKGERVMDPEFGSIIWDLLYEPIDESTKEDLVEDCKSIIASDPRVQLIDLILDDVGNGIRVDIQINVLPYNQQASMQVNFERETL